MAGAAGWSRAAGSGGAVCVAVPLSDLLQAATAARRAAVMSIRRIESPLIMGCPVEPSSRLAVWPFQNMLRLPQREQADVPVQEASHPPGKHRLTRRLGSRGHVWLEKGRG